MNNEKAIDHLFSELWWSDLSIGFNLKVLIARQQSFSPYSPIQNLKLIHWVLFYGLFLFTFWYFYLRSLSFTDEALLLSSILLACVQLFSWTIYSLFFKLKWQKRFADLSLMRQAEILSNTEFRSAFLSFLSVAITLMLILNSELVSVSLPRQLVTQGRYSLILAGLIGIGFLILSVPIAIAWSKTKSELAKFLEKLFGTYGLTFLLATLALMVSLGIELSNPADILTLLALSGIAIALQSFLFLPSIVAYISLFPMLKAAFRLLWHLIHSSLSILTLTIIIALIPFLNADSWQLITGIRNINMGVLFLVVYIFPMLLLIFPNRHMLYAVWNPNVPDKFGDIWNSVEDVETKLDKVTRAWAKWNFHSNGLALNDLDIFLIRLTLMLKLGLLLLLLPSIVFLFSWIVFNIIISNEVLQEWLLGYEEILENTSLNALRVRAAMVLGIVSATTSLGNVLASSDRLRIFLDETILSRFAEEIRVFGLFKVLEKGLDQAKVSKDSS